MTGQRHDLAPTQDSPEAPPSQLPSALPNDTPYDTDNSFEKSGMVATHPASDSKRRWRRALMVAVPTGLLAAGLSVVAGRWANDHFGPQQPDGTFVLDTPGVYNAPNDTSLHNHQADGKPLPTVELVDEGGQKVPLSITRPTIINVWFSTCAPCGQELPAFAAIDEEFGDRIDIIGVDPFDTESAMTKFAAGRGVEYELLRDPDNEFTNMMGLVAFPVTLFVNSNGVIVRQLGTVDASDLRANIAELFPEVTTSSGAQPTGEHAGHETGD